MIKDDSRECYTRSYLGNIIFKEILDGREPCELSSISLFLEALLLMLNLKDVEDAKALMREAVNWSVVHWLAEKKRVRRAADRANAVLDTLHHELQSSWSEELKAAYDALQSNPPGRKTSQESNHSSAATKQLAKQLKQSYDTAYHARMDAEDTFDLAERKLSTALAREGTRKAILSWELYENAIAKSRAAVQSRKSAS